jgi:hypothetical protein
MDGERQARRLRHSAMRSISFDIRSSAPWFVGL